VHPSHEIQPPVIHPDAPPPGTELPSHYHHCYGCGPGQAAGLRMRMTVGEGMTVHARFEVTDDHQGAPGLAHGGLLACAMDEALGTLGWLLGTPAVTARLESDFRIPVPVGTVLHIRSECIGVAGRKIFLRATAHMNDPAGPIAVQANALFLAVELAHFAQHGRAGEPEAESVRINP
jgi:acyl-coenzyme A thioesterase PaaI-like protein